MKVDNFYEKKSFINFGKQLTFEQYIELSDLILEAILYGMDKIINTNKQLQEETSQWNT